MKLYNFIIIRKDIIIDYIISVSVWLSLFYNGYSRLILFIIFIIELLFIISNMIDIYYNDSYMCIKIRDVNDIDIRNMNIIKIWSYYIELNSFEKTYKFLSKKKINFKNIILLIIIYIFGIPMRMIRLINYRVISIRYRENIINICVNLSFENINKKIEVLNGKIELNCYTSRKLIENIINNTPKEKRNIENIINTLFKIGELRKNFNKLNKEREEFKHSIVFKDNKILHMKHFSYVDPKTGTMIHGTSNASDTNKFHKDQIITKPMPSLIKEGAEDPKTIITPDTVFDKFKWLNKSKFVNLNELNNVKFNNYDTDLFSMSKKDYERNRDLYNEMHDILWSDLRIHESDCKDIIREINQGFYDSYFEKLDFLEVNRIMNDNNDNDDRII